MTEAFWRGGPAASATRLQIRASNRSRRTPTGGGASEASAASRRAKLKPPFDPASLPPIESIGAGSDIRAFLAAGVPADLTRAALRRAWSSDPTIRDFVGLSENSWDFNAPGAMPGFGAIDKDEVARLVTRLLGEPDATAAAASRPLVSQEDKTETHERIWAGRGNPGHPGIGGAGSRARSTAATAGYHQRRQRCDAAPRSRSCAHK